MERNHHCGWNP